MPRNYVRKTGHGVKDFDALMKTIKEIKFLGIKIYIVARTHNIPKSTLNEYVSKLDNAVPEIFNISDDG